mgnify:CR=1 FL=1
MPTFTLRVPLTTSVSVDGAVDVQVIVIADEAVLRITTVSTTPAVATPVPPEYWQHDPENGIPGWNGDGPATGPTGVERFDPELENDPWLQGR